MKGDRPKLNPVSNNQQTNKSRSSLVVWLRNKNDYKKLYRYGDIVYISKAFNYAYLYLNQDKLPETREKLQSAHFVRKIQGSVIPKLDFSSQHEKDLIADLHEEAELFNQQNRDN